MSQSGDLCLTITKSFVTGLFKIKTLKRLMKAFLSFLEFLWIQLKPVFVVYALCSLHCWFWRWMVTCDGAAVLLYLLIRRGGHSKVAIIIFKTCVNKQACLLMPHSFPLPVVNDVSAVSPLNQTSTNTI